MVYKAFTIDWIKFIRKESFEPEISRALLVTLALIIPLGVAHAIGKPLQGTFVAITAQLITSAKIRGSYPQRAVILLIGTMAIALAAFLGTLAGGYFWATLIFMGIVAGIGSLARGIGEYGQVLGICGVILFLISLHEPNDLPTAVNRAFLIIIGGSWASILLLFLWPIRPLLPFYITLAKPWEISSTLIKLVAISTPDIHIQETAIGKEEIALRQAINNIVPLLKKNSKTARWHRKEIHRIVGKASRFGATALALLSEMAVLHKNEVYQPVIPAIQQAARSLGTAAQSISDIIIFGRKRKYNLAYKNLQKSVSTLAALKDGMGVALPQQDIHARIVVSGIISLFDSAIGYLQDTFQLLGIIQVEKKSVTHLPAVDVKLWFQKQWPALQLLLQPNSMLMKHSLRVVVVAALGISLYHIFEIPRGYWIVLTVMILLQPDFGSTKEKTKDRLLGTILGVILGSVLLIYHFHFFFLVAAIALCCFSFVYLLPKNYKFAVVFVTIMLVAMLEVSEPVDWHIAAYRVMSTAIGGILAIAAAYLLWPSWESIQFPRIMAKALRANKNFLLQIEYELAFKTGFHPRLIADRRKAEVENLNALESIKRLLPEPDHKQSKVKYAQKLTFHNTKLTRELVSFAAFLPGLHTGSAFPEATALIRQEALVLETMAFSIEQGQPFAANPDFAANLKHIDASIGSIQSQLQTSPPDRNKLEAELRYEELIHIQLVYITAEITAMLQLIKQDSAVTANK